MSLLIGATSALQGASGQGAAADLGDTINQSLRSRGPGTGRLARTPSSAGNRQTYTISFWIKHDPTNSRAIYAAERFQANTGSGRFAGNNGAHDPATNISWNVGDSRFRDPSAWYHWVQVMDTTNGTESERMRFYINGQRITAANGGGISQNYNTGWNAAVTTTIFDYADDADDGTANLDGYLAMFYNIDGTAIGETNGVIDEFGKYNEDNVWVPQDYTGSYGTNGFKLTFDSGQTNGVGHDSSGNGNNFTASGFETADVVKYSKDLFTSTNTSIDLTSTSKSFDNSSFPPKNAFDNNTSTQCTTSAASNTAIIFRPETALANVTQIEIFAHPTASVASYIGGFNGTGNETSIPNSGFQEIYNSSAITVSNIYIRSSDQAALTAIRINGSTVLTDNNDNDIDYEDTPTSNWTTLNAVDTSGVANLQNAMLSAGTTSAADTSGVRATQAVSSGKWYFEVTNTVASGTTNIQAGWASVDTAQRITTSSSNVYGMGIATNSTHMVALDVGSNAIWTGQDGTWDNSATISEIESGDTTNARHTSVTGYPLAPMFLDQASSFSGTASLNYGQMNFQYTPPTGFSSLQTNNLPEPTIKNGREYFDVLTYTGNDSTQSITGLEFQPDFVWIKQRNATENHFLTDSLRGAGIHLRSDTNAIDNDSSATFTQFTASGFDLTGTGSAAPQINDDTDTYVAWCWKCEESFTPTVTGVSSASGKRNTTAGFSILTYTGNNSSGTITHGLDSAPEFILFKRRSVLDNWVVYHAGIGATKSLTLDLDSASFSSTFLSNTAPTGPTDSPASTITLGGVSGANGTGTFVAYCWHSVEGFSKFGTYTGNGTGTTPDADGPFVYTGFRPAWVLIKREDSNFGGEWSIYDTTRDSSNPSRALLLADLSNGETTSGAVDFLSNGFKIRDGGGFTNQSGGSYVYAAFAENPFGGENAPPVTAR